VNNRKEHRCCIHQGTDRLFNSGWKSQGKHLGRKGQDTKEIKRALNLFADRKKNGLSVNTFLNKQACHDQPYMLKQTEGQKIEMKMYAYCAKWFPQTGIGIAASVFRKYWGNKKEKKRSDGFFLLIYL
jgi:hypothetical protein